MAKYLFFFSFFSGCALRLKSGVLFRPGCCSRKVPARPERSRWCCSTQKMSVLLIFFKLPRADLALPCALLPGTCLPGLGHLNSEQSNIFSPERFTSATGSCFLLFSGWLKQVKPLLLCFYHREGSIFPQTPLTPRRAWPCRLIKVSGCFLHVWKNHLLHVIRWQKIIPWWKTRRSCISSLLQSVVLRL